MERAITLKLQHYISIKHEWYFQCIYITLPREGTEENSLAIQIKVKTHFGMHFTE